MASYVDNVKHWRMLTDVDGDIFGAVTRLGRDAAEGVARATRGEAWDPFLAARCLDVLLMSADGVPSLPSVLRELEALRASPLLARTLVESSVKASCLKLVHQLRATQRGRSRMESSQRSRGLLFLAMGAVTASRFAMPTFSAYETGVGCINLPMSRAQVGAQGTRAMHPRTLALFDELLPSVLDRPARVVAPFFLLTKGETCRQAGAALSGLARLTMSCDEGEGHKPDAMEHCGLCTSCLFRRIALFSAGQPDPTRYRDVVMHHHGHYEQRVFENHATELLACETFSDLVAIDPNVRFASRLPLEGAVTRSEAESRILEMYRRYAHEIVAFFERARPTLARQPHPPRKENERDLFAAAG
jgi:hypothetical protein